MHELQRCADELMEDVEAISKFSNCGFHVLRSTLSSNKQNGVSSPASMSLLGAAFGVASRCSGCACHYAREAAHTGATRNAMKLALERGVLMASGPATIVAAEALCEYEKTIGQKTIRSRRTGNKNHSVSVNSAARQATTADGGIALDAA